VGGVLREAQQAGIVSDNGGVVIGRGVKADRMVTLLVTVPSLATGVFAPRQEHLEHTISRSEW
jgi:hypothetical protein